MSQNPDHKPDLWRYVHNELTESERSAFEVSLAADASLSEELSEVRRTHETLKELMPIIDQSKDELAETLLASWEADPSAAGPSQDAGPVGRSGRPIPFLRPLVLAAAAVLVLFIGFQAVSFGPLRWDVQVGELQYRAGDPAQPVYSHRALKSYARALKGEVNRAYELGLGEAEPGDSTRPKRPGHLELMVQELPGGALNITVAAYEDDPQQGRRWEGLFESTEHFRERLPGFANEIASGLIAFRQEE